MQSLRHKLLVWQVVFLLFGAGNAYAYDIFIIDNVYSDQAADNPTRARELAIDDAQMQAYDILIKSILDANLIRSLPKLTPDGVSAMVKSFEITEERITGNRYQARFNVMFNDKAVKEFLATNNVSELMLQSPPIFVLPVFLGDSGMMLWGPESPWRKAWEAPVPEESPVRVVSPIGDLEDAQIISTEDLQARKFDALLRFANKYGAREAVVATARPLPGQRLHVLLQPIGKQGLMAGLENYTEEFDGANGDYYADAVASVRRKMEEQMQGKERPLAVLSGNVLNVVVALEGAKDWAAIRHKLESVAPIARLSITELSLYKAVLEIEFKGNMREFQQALDERGLELLQEQDSYILREATPL